MSRYEKIIIGRPADRKRVLRPVLKTSMEGADLRSSGREFQRRGENEQKAQFQRRGEKEQKARFQRRGEKEQKARFQRRGENEQKARSPVVRRRVRGTWSRGAWLERRERVGVWVEMRSQR